MRKGLFLLLCLVFCFGLADLSRADELAELKSMVKQLLEQNKALSAKVKELEKRLEAYEERRGQTLEASAAETPSGKKWYDRMQIDLSVASVVQGVVGVDKDLANIYAHGGREPAGRAGVIMRDEDKAYASASVDLKLYSEFSKTDRGFVLLEMGSGKNPESEIPSFSGIVDEAISMVPVETDDGDVRISEAWYEKDFPFGSGKFRVRFGKIDITTEVDQNAFATDENTQFLSPAFINNPAVEWASYSFGVVLAYEAENWSLTLGYEDADSGWDNLFDYPFLVAQLAFKTNFSNLEGNYRFYVWYQGEKHLEWDEFEDYFAGLKARPENEDPAWGFGLSFDQKLTEEIGLFFRYGYRGKDLVGYAYYDEDGNFDLDATNFSYGFKHAFTGGFSLSGALWGRSKDEIGLGFAYFVMDDDYEDYWEAKGVYAARLAIDPLHEHAHEVKDEYHVEVYYRFQATENLALTPDFQYTWNPAGLDDDGFWVFSLRGVWDF